MYSHDYISWRHLCSCEKAQPGNEKHQQTVSLGTSQGSDRSDHVSHNVADQCRAEHERKREKEAGDRTAGPKRCLLKFFGDSLYI